MPWPKAARDARWPKRPDSYYVDQIRARCETNDKGCWLWTGPKHTNGYALRSIRFRTERLHRWMYQVYKGPIPAGYHVCHTCDIRHCCNPDHLWAGTKAQNEQDKVRKGRHELKSRTHCINGHVLAGDNIVVNVDERNWVHRTCKTCNRIRNRLKAGWPRHLAETMPLTPKGHRPVGGTFPRRRRLPAAQGSGQ